GEILVRAGQGGRDRRAMLPAALSPPISQHLERVRALHDRGLRRGAGAVTLPDALERKLPAASREFGWQWAFPATRSYVERATGIDRKSTRLNSSHVKISYAVFCLKKK